MTATRPTQRRPRLRFASMESLGFMEQPYDSSVSAIRATTTPPAAHRPKVPTGRHVKTPLGEQSLADWAPVETPRRLTRRDFRWWLILLVLAAVAATTYLGFWLYQRPLRLADEAAATVATSAEELINALTEVAVFAPTIGDDDAVVSNGETLMAADAAARRLFESATGLASTQQSTRATATDTSGAALEATRRLTDAIAFQAAMDSTLVMPEFVTDPSLIDLATATRDFGTWRANLDEVAAALPQGVDRTLSAHFDELRSSLAGAQSQYVDSLRLDDQERAVAVLGVIEADLASLRSEIQQTLGRIGAEVSESLDSTIADLSQLIG